MAGLTATFCGHCGASLAPGATFCGRCGTPVAMPAAAAPSAAPPAAAQAPAVAPPPPAFTAPPAVAAPRSKLSHSRVLLFGGGGIAVLVIVITVIAVHLVTSAPHCGFYCGPKVGARLAGATSFTDRKWGFIIDYGKSQLTLNTTDPNSDKVDFTATDPDGNAVGGLTFTGMPATSAQQAVQTTLQNDFPSSQYQDVQPVEGVPGAEIALIPATGSGYTANQASSDGSSDNRVGVIVMATRHNNETVVVSMWSLYSTDSDAPFYLLADSYLDAAVSNMHFSS